MLVLRTTVMTKKTNSRLNTITATSIDLRMRFQRRRSGSKKIGLDILFRSQFHRMLPLPRRQREQGCPANLRFFKTKFGKSGWEKSPELHSGKSRMREMLSKWTPAGAI